MREAAVSVIVVASPDAPGSATLARSLQEDPAAREVLPIVGPGRAEEMLAAVRAARGDIVLVLDEEVVPAAGLASAHARRHEAASRLLVLGDTPVRVLRQRAPDDYATELRAADYERRREQFAHDPGAILANLPEGNFSLRRDDFLATGVADGPWSSRVFGRRCERAGLDAVFDPALRALRIHERSLAGFVRDARAAGAESARLGRPPAPHSAGRAALALALRAVVGACGAAHVWGPQDAAARVLWRLEEARGGS